MRVCWAFCVRGGGEALEPAVDIVVVDYGRLATAELADFGSDKGLNTAEAPQFQRRGTCMQCAECLRSGNAYRKVDV